MSWDWDSDIIMNLDLDLDLGFKFVSNIFKRLHLILPFDRFGVGFFKFLKANFQIRFRFI